LRVQNNIEVKSAVVVNKEGTWAQAVEAGAEAQEAAEGQVVARAEAGGQGAVGAEVPVVAAAGKAWVS
jgi:hypothetical protein